MAILVTGGAGYVGSVAVEHLLSREESVVVLDNLSRGHRQAVPVNVPFYEGNVGDRDLLAHITRDNDIESCIHFAAFAYVDESVKEPRKYFENNVEQGITLFGSLLQAGVRLIIFSSSCTTYGEPQSLPIRGLSPTASTIGLRSMVTPESRAKTQSACYRTWMPPFDIVE